MQEIGRWASRDPIEEEGGVNSYCACLNDCISAVDSLGEWSFTIKELSDSEAGPREDWWGGFARIRSWWVFTKVVGPVSSPGGCRYKVDIDDAYASAEYWVKSVSDLNQRRRIRRHELTHVRHYRASWNALRRDAEGIFLGLYSERKAQCLSALIDNELSRVYKDRAVATTATWDYIVHASTSHEADYRAARDAALAAVRISGAAWVAGSLRCGAIP
jgi:hypothetical protein